MLVRWDRSSGLAGGRLDRCNGWQGWLLKLSWATSHLLHVCQPVLPLSTWSIPLLVTFEERSWCRVGSRGRTRWGVSKKLVSLTVTVRHGVEGSWSVSRQIIRFRTNGEHCAKCSCLINYMLSNSWTHRAPNIQAGMGKQSPEKDVDRAAAIAVCRNRS